MSNDQSLSKRRGGTPPPEHRFRPGQSGNPGGRPRKAATARDVLWEALQQPMMATIDGQRQRLTTLEALTKAYIAQCTKNPTELLRALRFLEGDRPPPIGAPEDDGLDADDAALLEDLADRLQRRGSRPEQSDEGDDA